MSFSLKFSESQQRFLLNDDPSAAETRNGWVIVMGNCSEERFALFCCLLFHSRPERGLKRFTLAQIKAAVKMFEGFEKNIVEHKTRNLGNQINALQYDPR